MGCSEIVLDGTKFLGRSAKSRLSKVAGSPTLAEVEASFLEDGASIPEPFAALFDQATSSPADTTASPFPQVVVKPLALLFSQFRVTKNAFTGRTHFNHGTDWYADNLRGKWDATPADTQFHQEQIKSMNLALLMLDQEFLGIKNPKLRTRLRFFSLAQAQETMSDPTQMACRWAEGLERPDDERRFVIIRKKMRTGYQFAAFTLVVPTTLPWLMDIYLEKSISPNPWQIRMPGKPIPASQSRCIRKGIPLLGINPKA